MIPDIPWYITLTIVTLDLALIFSLWRLLDVGARRAGFGDATRRRIGRTALAAMLAWFGAALIAAPSPAAAIQEDPFRVTPLIPLFAGGSMTAALLAAWRLPDFRRALLGIPLAATVGVQYYRLIGAIFVILLALGQLPAHFALPAGWGDIAVGLLAPLVALALWRAPALGRPLAWAWNGLGVLDLVVAVGTGTGHLAPFLFPELGVRVPAAAAMGAFPLLLVPAFTVPISLLLHFLALAQLRRGEAIGAGAPMEMLGAAGVRS